MKSKSYLKVNREQIKVLHSVPKDQEIVMLNLLKYKKKVVATGLSGEASYAHYLQAATPFFKKITAEILFFGKPQLTLIGPEDETLWDAMILVKYSTPMDFFNIARAEGYPTELREQALEDSRLIYCSPHPNNF